MYMDVIRLFAKSEKKKKKTELETLIPAVRIYREDIGMEFGIEKCAMLIMRNEKRHTTKGIEIPNQEKIKTEEKKLTSTWEYWKRTISIKRG